MVGLVAIAIASIPKLFRIVLYVLSLYLSKLLLMIVLVGIDPEVHKVAIVIIRFIFSVVTIVGVNLLVDFAEQLLIDIAKERLKFWFNTEDFRFIKIPLGVIGITAGMVGAFSIVVLVLQLGMMDDLSVDTSVNSRDMVYMYE